MMGSEWGMGGVGLGGLLLLAGVVVLVVWLVRMGGGKAGAESPEEILKRRYAGGEIDREEYQRRLSDLRK